MTEPFEVKLAGEVYRAHLPPAIDRLRAANVIRGLAEEFDLEGCRREMISALVDAELPREPLEELNYGTLVDLFAAYSEWTQKHMVNAAPDPRVGPIN